MVGLPCSGRAMVCCPPYDRASSGGLAGPNRPNRPAARVPPQEAAQPARPASETRRRLTTPAHREDRLAARTPRGTTMLLRSALLAAAALACRRSRQPRRAQTPVPNPWPGLGITCDSRGLAGTPYVAGVNCRHLLQNGYPRRYVVFVPQSAVDEMNAGRPVPLVFMLHGSTGTGEQFLKMSGWRQKATAEGFVAAFPTGLEYLVTERNGPPAPQHEVELVRPDLDHRPVRPPARLPAGARRRSRPTTSASCAPSATTSTTACGSTSGAPTWPASRAAARCAPASRSRRRTSSPPRPCNAGGLDTIRPTTPGPSARAGPVHPRHARRQRHPQDGGGRSRT